MDKSVIDVVWITLCAGMVFLMQAGFLCLESGLTRSKNNINVALKNITDLGISTLLYWAFGFALMFGATQNGWIGFSTFAPDINEKGMLFTVFLLYQLLYCGTAVTILSGAVAERMTFSSYIVIAAVVSGLIYPIFGHWVWNGIDTGQFDGWLGGIGFVDFAGSTVIHSVGGWVSLAAIIVIGPRSGRFPKGAPARSIPGANIPLAVVGAILLWFGWFGFTGGSTFELNEKVPIILFNTLMGGASGLLVALLLGWVTWRRADVSFVINGSLSGLVAVTANCHAINTISAIVIGGVGGAIMLIITKLLVEFRIDDAIGAIPVHLGAGIWGTLAVAIFGDLSVLGTGLSRHGQLLAQLIGIVTCCVWTFGISYIVLSTLDRFFPLRVSSRDEKIGLNVSEHGVGSELIQLVNVMETQAKTGDLNLRVPVEPFTEVGQIAVLYNRVMEALEQAVVTTEAIVKTAMDAIITFSEKDFVITTANPSAEAIFGYKKARIIGQPITTLMDMSGKVSEDDSTCSDEAALSQTFIGYNCRELVGRRANGQTFPMEVTITHAEAGAESFFTGTFRDITDRKNSMEELKKSKVAAEGANRAKSEFLANMSHEHRTPLNGILGYAQILKNDTSLTSKQMKAVRIIEKSGQHLLNLINEVLDYSKVEAGKMTLAPTDIDFIKFLSSIEELFRFRAVEKGITFTFEPITPLPQGVTVDEKKLRQILLNLLGNAIKFTKAGSVKLKVGRSNGKIRFIVEDTGIGVAPDKLDEMFYAFHQVGDQSSTPDGTGLGLAISKKFVEMMGSELKVKSKLNEGSVFWFELDLPNASHRIDRYDTEILSIEKVTGNKRKLLVIDDKVENRIVLLDILVPLGFDVLEASSGEDCLQIAQKFEPDAFLIDIVMPGMDGFELTRRLRESALFKDKIIVAVSANVSEEYRQKSFDVGCDGFIPKPVTQGDLLELLCLKLDLNISYRKSYESDLKPKHSKDDSDADIYMPPVEYTNTLSELAIRGDIKRIFDQLDKIEKLDERYKPFTSTLRKLAKKFQVKKILELIYKWKAQHEQK